MDISYYYAVYRNGTRSFFIREIWRYRTFCGCYFINRTRFYIVYSTILQNEETRTAPIGISLFVFAFGVSIDSFSVGLSLGIYGAQTIITILLLDLLACY